MVSAEEGDLQPEFLGRAVGASRGHALVEGLRHGTGRDDRKWCVTHSEQKVRRRRWWTGETRARTHLFVSLFPAAQSWPVVVPKAEEVVVGHQALDGVPHHVDVHGLLGNTVPEHTQTERLFGDLVLKSPRQCFQTIVTEMRKVHPL